MLSPQENMSPIHDETPKTPEVEQSRITCTKVDGKEKEIIVNNKIVSTPHIEGGKESNEVEPSATIVDSRTYAQARLSGDTPSPNLKEVPRRNTPSPRRKRKKIKDVSLDIEVSLDETIKMP